MTTADLVIEGGGLKGTALVGAVTALTGREDPYDFHRIAGTSAGAIVASFLAAGIDPAASKQIMTAQDFSQFEDESAVSNHFKLVGEGFGQLFHEGLFAGDVQHGFIAQHLADRGVRTWSDLKVVDDELPVEQRYRLVVVVLDVSHGRTWTTRSCSSRTIFVDTTGYSATNFHLTDADKMTLFSNGQTAAQQFLSTCDYQRWLAANPPRAPRPPFDSADGSPTDHVQGAAAGAVSAAQSPPAGTGQVPR